MIKVLLFGESKVFCEPLACLLTNQKGIVVHSICYKELGVFQSLEKQKNIKAVIIYHHKKRHDQLQGLLVTEFPQLKIFNVSNVMLEDGDKELQKLISNDHLGNEEPSSEDIIGELKNV